MKMNEYEKYKLSIGRFYLEFELFANVQRSSFLKGKHKTFFRAFKLLNETKKLKRFKYSISVGGVMFQIYEM